MQLKSHLNPIEMSKIRSQVLRKQNKDKKKIPPTTWRIIIISIIVALILSIIAVGIYLAIRFIRSTTSTTIVANPVLRWNVTGITIAGIGGSAGVNANQLKYPLDIALGSSNAIYVADCLNNRVQYWNIGNSSGTTVAGQSNGNAGTNATYLRCPTGLYVDSNDNVYVSDSQNNRIQLWNHSASIGTMVAGTGMNGSANNQLFSPCGIVQNPSTKTLYIVDYTNQRVMSYTSGASTGTVVAGGNGLGTSNIQLNNPVGIYFDSFTNSLLIANHGANNIVRWVLGASSWTLVAGNINGSSGNSSTTLNSPAAVILDPMGNVYVADSLNNRIQLFMSSQSEGITILGMMSTNSSNFTQFATPYAVRLDNQLNLYVVDTGNNRVLKFLRY
ncbi:unnamed protein product [Adineta ricciae]|uniref:NHL repeat containing protein n=1 Tax=Adineta ricciae TaxID=249248 RepID=A0A815L803_ADIRI|nr:unnamed protein product [Adineta ricciae]